MNRREKREKNKKLKEKSLYLKEKKNVHAFSFHSISSIVF